MKRKNALVDWRSVPVSVWAFIFVKLTSDENPWETLGFTREEEDQIIAAHDDGLLDE